MIYDWYFPTILIVIMAVFNDGAMIALSKDRVVASQLPNSWNLNNIFIMGIVYGLYLTLSTWALYQTAVKTHFFENHCSLFSLNDRHVVLEEWCTEKITREADMVSCLELAVAAGCVGARSVMFKCYVWCCVWVCGWSSCGWAWCLGQVLALGAKARGVCNLSVRCTAHYEQHPDADGVHMYCLPFHPQYAAQYGSVANGAFTPNPLSPAAFLASFQSNPDSISTCNIENYASQKLEKCSGGHVSFIG